MRKQRFTNVGIFYPGKLRRQSLNAFNEDTDGYWNDRESRSMRRKRERGVEIKSESVTKLLNGRVGSRDCMSDSCFVPGILCVGLCGFLHDHHFIEFLALDVFLQK